MHTESQWSGRLGVAAVMVLLTTVCALPWLHGGNIPLARLVLQAGAAAAAVLSLFSCLLRRERAGYPPIVFPLALLAAVGVIQLVPLHASIISQMNHAVHADLRAQFTGGSTGELMMRTASPGDTRIVVAQLVALMLLSMTAFDQLRSRRAVFWSLAVITLNAAALSVLALAQLFQQELFLIRSEWWTGMGSPFGTFVNPNNAAGWLLMGMACAVGFLVLQSEEDTDYHRFQASAGRSSIRLVESVVRYLARLTSAQVIAWIMMAVIVSAMLATRSRTGMVAAGAAFVVTVLVRIRGRRIGEALLVSAVGGALVAGLMAVLNLQEAAMQELRTLKDPSGALAGRLQHWKDSIDALRDFPVFGSGLGAYRYTTLPYQHHNTGFWFQHADNQYVEVLVEAGAVGFLAFLMLGAPILVGSVRVIRQSVAGGLGRHAETVAFVLLFATVAQGVAALADYGVVLPSTSALFVTLISMLAAVQAEARSWAMVPGGRIVMAGTRIALIIGALVFTRDLVLAHDCYLVVIQTEKVSAEPLTWDTIEQREAILERARVVLDRRSDDARTHEAVSRLLRDVTRSKFLRGLPGIDEAESLKSVWPYTAGFTVARRIDLLNAKPQRQQYLRSVLQVRTQQSGMIEHCSEVLQRMPLAGPVVRRAARWSSAAGIDDPGEQFAARARFTEPANGLLALQFGELELRSGDQEKAVDIWNRALKLDDALRSGILNVYESLGRLEDGLAAFGPRTYSQAVTALEQSPGPELKNRLFDIADELWTDPQAAPPVDVQAHRSRHLKYLGESKRQERIDWLQRCVVWSPGEVGFHRELAEMLSRVGRYRESLDAWNVVLRSGQYDVTAEREIARVQAKLNAKNRQESRR